jgi:hypothetical protein
VYGAGIGAENGPCALWALYSVEQRYNTVEIRMNSCLSSQWWSGIACAPLTLLVFMSVVRCVKGFFFLLTTKSFAARSIDASVPEGRVKDGLVCCVCTCIVCRCITRPSSP